MSKKKISTKVRAQAKRAAAVAKVFGADQVDVDIHYTDWLYARRHCATVRKDGWVQLAYEVDMLALEETISKTLVKIRRRDGKKICQEVADALVERIEVLVSAAMKDSGRGRSTRRADNRRSASH